MSPQLTLILGVAAVVFVTLVFVVIWASRYVKVGPNRVLVVSGRQHLLPDGTRVGFRIVKGGGTFVFPVIEKVDRMALTNMTIDLRVANAFSKGGVPLNVQAIANVKVPGEEPLRGSAPSAGTATATSAPVVGP